MCVRYNLRGGASDYSARQFWSLRGHASSYRWLLRSSCLQVWVMVNNSDGVKEYVRVIDRGFSFGPWIWFKERASYFVLFYIEVRDMSLHEVCILLTCRVVASIVWIMQRGLIGASVNHTPNKKHNAEKKGSEKLLSNGSPWSTQYLSKSECDSYLSAWGVRARFSQMSTTFPGWPAQTIAYINSQLNPAHHTEVYIYMAI